MKHISTREAGGDRLQKLIAQRPAKPAPGTRLLVALNPAVKAAKVAPVIDHKGDTNEVATLIKSIHAAGRMATNQHRSMKGK